MTVGIGIDVVDVARMQHRLHTIEGLSNQIFTAQEQQFCEAQRQPAASYAGCFAAKEAFLKAAGIGLQKGLTFTEIEIVNHVPGPPELILHDKLKSRLEFDSGTSWLLSLARTGQLACAVVTLEQKRNII